MATHNMEILRIALSGCTPAYIVQLACRFGRQSAASICEISIKCALGKLEADPAEVLADDDVLGGYGDFVEVV
jgi:hypothetical protein